MPRIQKPLNRASGAVFLCAVRDCVSTIHNIHKYTAICAA